jgi:hypothetical protein
MLQHYLVGLLILAVGCASPRGEQDTPTTATAPLTINVFTEGDVRIYEVGHEIDQSGSVGGSQEGTATTEVNADAEVDSGIIRVNPRAARTAAMKEVKRDRN